jgi:hypothetical protein
MSLADEANVRMKDTVDVILELGATSHVKAAKPVML